MTGPSPPPEHGPEPSEQVASTASSPAPPESDASAGDAPFAHLKLSSDAPLRDATRALCPGPCGKRRRYYCSECVVPLAPSPRVDLPVHVDIIQAGAEVPQRSTAQHVALLAPGHATVWRPFPECGARLLEEVVRPAAPGSIAVLYPGDDAKTPEQAAAQMPHLRRVIVVDASWPKSVLLMQTPWLAELPRVTLPAAGGATRFWRYAPVRSDASHNFSAGKVAALTSTVESVHRFCDALGRAHGRAPGFCDDLLWLFAFLYGRVKDVYEKAPGKRDRIMRKSKGLLHHL